MRPLLALCHQLCPEINRSENKYIIMTLYNEKAHQSEIFSSPVPKKSTVWWNAQETPYSEQLIYVIMWIEDKHRSLDVFKHVLQA